MYTRKNLLQVSLPHPSSHPPPCVKHSAREDLNNAIAACTDHQSPILTPRDAADAFTSHGSVGDDVLSADAFLQAPETDRGVVAGGDGFAAVLREAEG